MEYTHLGKSGLNVSRLCLGTMNFGWHTNEEDSFAIMDKALDMGINFFDTADMYGWGGERGSTEEIVGRWLAQGGDRRDSIVLATKLYNPMGRSDRRPEYNRDNQGLSKVKIMRHCEDSLRRLQTDVIDLYQMHHIDRVCPVEEVWEAMDTLQTQGKILYVGSSNFAGWDIATYSQFRTMQHKIGLVSEQTHYNLNTRTPELEVVPSCRHHGLGLIPWSPLAGGLLAGVLEKSKRGNRRNSDWVDPNIEKNRDKLEKYEALCQKLGEEPHNVALAWLLHNPVVTAPIIGPRTMEQLTGSERAVELKLSDETVKELEDIFPGPGGEAPKAYAW